MPSLPPSIRHRGRRYPVLDQIAVGRMRYLLLKRFERDGRTRLRVFERFPGVGGAMRTVHILPRSPRSRQLLETLNRVSQGNTSLPTVLYVNQDGQRTTIVTSWIEGESLRTFFDRARDGRRKWPSPMVACHRFRRFVHGLCLFHDRSHVVHADLKPDNLILGGEPPELVMVDFGSSWYEENAVRRDVGDGKSLAYAAPEMHAVDVTPDQRCDQFSATAIFYEMLTGEVPYEGLGGQAGWDEFRDECANSFVPPSQKCDARDLLSPKTWKLVDRLATRGLSLEANRRFSNSREWRNSVDEMHREMHRDEDLSLVNRAALKTISWVRDRFSRN